MVNLWYQEQFNNLTWDIELNPSSFWLFMRDIDEAALNLKTAIYSWNINLTADLYKQAELMAEKKYSLITTNWQISGNQLAWYYMEYWVPKDIDMTDKNPWLYMDHMRMWYWSGTGWKARIANTWEMFLWSALDTNYLYWSWSVLTIKWNLILTNWQTVQEAIDDIDVSWDWLSDKPSVLSLAALSNPTPSWSWLFISSTHMWYYSWWQWKTYMQSNGNFWLSWSWSNYLSWNGSTLTVRWDIQATSATFNYAGSNSTWWAINKWFTSSNLSTVSNPSTWVKIDSSWIYAYKSWVNTVAISNTWDATFSWRVGANWIKSWDNYNYIEVKSDRIYIWVYDWWQWFLASIQWYSLNQQFYWVRINWDFFNTETSIFSWKLKIPVWTNLYE